MFYFPHHQDSMKNLFLAPPKGPGHPSQPSRSSRRSPCNSSFYIHTKEGEYYLKRKCKGQVMNIIMAQITHGKWNIRPTLQDKYLASRVGRPSTIGRANRVDVWTGGAVKPGVLEQLLTSTRPGKVAVYPTTHPPTQVFPACFCLSFNDENFHQSELTIYFSFPNDHHHHLAQPHHGHDYHLHVL